jgi:hypothetical protein
MTGDGSAPTGEPQSGYANGGSQAPSHEPGLDHRSEPSSDRGPHADESGFARTAPLGHDSGSGGDSSGS